MKRAAALGIFALGLTGLLAIACAPAYGEADTTGNAQPEQNTNNEKLPSDPADASKPRPSPSPGKGNGATSITSSDGGSAPPKTPGSESDAGTFAATLDGGACNKPPSTGGYVIHEPTPQAIGACSTSDIGYYEGLLAVQDQTFGGIKKALAERSELCASCVFSKYEDETWTPIVMLGVDTGFYNWGSCYANSPGGSVECATQVQQWYSCLDDACGDCVSDADYNTCIDKASADKTQCGALSFSACGESLPDLNAACDSIAKSITVACGP